MVFQLPEEKRDLVKGLFKKRQPNNSAMRCCLKGDIPGHFFVDDVNAPTKAVCYFNWTWAFVSDDADVEWAEEAITEICKHTWLNVIWNTNDRPQKPQKGIEAAVPRLEFIGVKEGWSLPQTNLNAEFKFFDSEIFDKAMWKEDRLVAFGTKENFLNKAFGICAIQDGQICSECCASFQANGYTEIGAVTADNKRRQGFALATCSRVIDEILKRGMTPSWSCDVRNTESAALAKKLGFNEPVPYEILYFPQRG